jgi:putative two-component system response regulator
MAENIVVIERETIVRDTLARILRREGYRVHTAQDAPGALELVTGLRDLALVVADDDLTYGSGLAAYRQLKTAHPMVRSVILAKEAVDGSPASLWDEEGGRVRKLGLDDCLVRPFEMDALVATVGRLLHSLAAERERNALLERLRKNVVKMVDSLAQALEARDPYTAGHSLRVAEFSLMIAAELGFSDLEMAVLEHGAALHDIGKIAVRQEVLHKPSHLTEEEFEHIKIHPVVGREILEPIDDFKDMLDLVYYHHERIDGKGYPEGLKGDRIPLMAQIVAVADTYDAMTSDRPYRRGMPSERALLIMNEVAGTQLNAEFVAILTRRIRAIEAIPDQTAG